MNKDVSPLRVGIIGASSGNSWAARSHVPAIASVAGLELTAVATSRIETARASAEQFGARHAFVGIDDLVASDDVDLIIVAVKVPTHLEFAAAALAAGKHVYCEWPLGVDTADAERIADLANGASGRNAIGLQARSSPTLRYMRDLVQSGFVGDVESASVTAYSSRGADPVLPQKEYLYKEEAGANLLTIEAGHLIDSLAFVLGEARSATSLTTTRRPNLRQTDGRPFVAETADTFATIMTLESGAVVSVHIAQGSHSLVTTRISILGSRGTLQLSTTEPGGIQMAALELWGADTLTTPMKRLRPPVMYSRVSAPAIESAVNVAEALHDFANYIRTGSQNTPSFDDAVARHHSLDRVMFSQVLVR